MARSVDLDKQQKYFYWLDLPENERKPRAKAALARQLKVTVQTFANWEKERAKNPPVENEEYSSVDFLQGRIKDMDIALLKSCVSGNAAAQRVLRQVLGQLIERPEQKAETGFDADELFRIRNEARRELEAEGFPIKGS